MGYGFSIGQIIFTKFAFLILLIYVIGTN